LSSSICDKKKTIIYDDGFDVVVGVVVLYLDKPSKQTDRVNVNK